MTANWRHINSVFLCARFSFASACMLALLTYRWPPSGWPNEGRWSRLRIPSWVTLTPQPTHACTNIYSLKCCRGLTGTKMGSTKKIETLCEKNTEVIETCSSIGVGLSFFSLSKTERSGVTTILSLSGISWLVSPLSSYPEWLFALFLRTSRYMPRWCSRLRTLSSKCFPFCRSIRYCVDTRHRRDAGEVEVQLFFFFNFGARWGWVFSATSRPLSSREGLGPHCLEAGWAPGSVWTDAEKENLFARTVVRIPNRPARSK